MATMTPTELAIQEAGGQTAVSKALNIKPQAVFSWIKRNRVPSNRVIALEKMSGVNRSSLRPDLYPVDSAQAA